MQAQKPPPLVAVVGGSAATRQEIAAAESVGRRLAECGAVLLCGGRGGVMEAACRGAKSAGGLTVGILPGADAQEANPYVDIPISTGIGGARNTIIALSAQAVIAIGGSYGTLSEIAYALQFGKPVIALGSWHLQRAGHPPAPIRRADTPEEAVRWALS
ncbi:MAG: TIGR00725 family protein [Anaerolineae bacterium]|nr:TIGR00725 family protein [Anaerolineae bacterium]